MVDKRQIPRGRPLVVTLAFPVVEPYAMLAVYRGRQRSGRGKKAPHWENFATKGKLHARAVEAIADWREATDAEIAAGKPGVGPLKRV